MEYIDNDRWKEHSFDRLTRYNCVYLYKKQKSSRKMCAISCINTILLKTLRYAIVGKERKEERKRRKNETIRGRLDFRVSI